MAARARLGNVQRVDLRTRVARSAQTMHTMAIDANRDFRVAFCEKLSVHAGLVLAQLICPQGRVVLPHEGRIGVAASAESWNLTPLDLSSEAGRFAHGIWVGLRGITAMATRAGQPFLRVDVAGELLLGYLKRGIERPVAVEASVLRLRKSRAAAGRHHKQLEERAAVSVISPCIHRSSLR